MRTLQHTLALAPLCLLAACSGAKTSVAPEEPEAPAILPALSIEPEVWETAGSEIVPTLRFEEPVSHDYDIEFEYSGGGDLDLPDGASIAAGESEVTIDGAFSAEAPSSAAGGTVTAYLVDRESDERFAVAEWPVLIRPSIIRGIEVLRTRAQSDGQLYSCFVAVDYDPMEGGHEAPADRHEQLQVTASVERQGRFAPQTTVERHVEQSAYPDLPAELSADGDQPVFYVSVADPQFPQVRRAYLKIEVSIGGDTEEQYVALPNR